MSTLLKKEKKHSFNVLVHQYIDTWKCLPDYFQMPVDGVMCDIRIQHGYPRIVMNNMNKGLDHGWDLIITNQDDVEFIDERKVVMPRYRKSYQAKVLKDCYAKNPETFHGFIPLLTFDINGIENSGYRNTPLLPEGRYVIKPNYGARGVALLFFNVDNKRNVTLTSALKKLDDAFMAAGSSGIPKLNDPDCQFITGDFRGEEEVKTIWQSERGWCLQKVVSMVSAEYRIIKGHGKIDFILKRPTHVVDGQQVVSAKSDELLFSDYSKEFPGAEHYIPERIVAFIEAHLPDFSSIDLFIREDGGWGIFEYSNQFFLEDISQEDVVRAHRKWLEAMLLSKYTLEN